jgi:hypothetical protein
VSGDREAASLTGSAEAPPDAADSDTQDRAQMVQRWRETREMLIQQLDAFETGALTLRANNVNVSAAAIADLKRSIFEFDALISQPG